MRLFLGLELPDDVKQYIEDYTLPLRVSNKGWEHSHDYHLTLLFIGPSSEEDYLLIQQRLAGFEFEPFRLQLRGLDFFNRRVAYISLESSPELLQLKNKMEELFPEWVKPNQKEFIPHITVKRWQRYEYDALKEGLAARAMERRIFDVSALILFKSEKDELNRKYHVVERWVLGKKKPGL